VCANTVSFCWRTCSISSPSSCYLCVCQSRSSVDDSSISRVVEILQFCKTCCFTRLFLRSEMKQGSAFPYISYAVARCTRVGFSLMTHCICHERGTRFNAVPGSTPNSPARFKIQACVICVCANHVTVLRTPCSISSPSSRPRNFIFLSPSKFLSRCVCENHVPVRRWPCSISRLSSRQLFVYQSRFSVPEALLDFKSNLTSVVCICQSLSSALDNLLDFQFQARVSHVCANHVPVCLTPC
jgi:hypothetical protein